MTGLEGAEEVQLDKDNLTLAAEAFRASRRIYGRGAMLSNDERGKLEPQWQAHEAAIKKAKDEGRSMEDIEEKAAELELKTAQNAYLELTKLHEETGGFPMGKTT